MPNLELLAELIADTVKEFPDGAPLGPMYLAFVQHGMSADCFNATIELLVKSGKVRRSNNQLFPVL